MISDITAPMIHDHQATGEARQNAPLSKETAQAEFWRCKSNHVAGHDWKIGRLGDWKRHAGRRRKDCYLCLACSPNSMLNGPLQQKGWPDDRMTGCAVVFRTSRLCCLSQSRMSPVNSCRLQLPEDQCSFSDLVLICDHGWQCSGTAK